MASLLGSENDFLGGSDGKESAYNTGDPGLIPRSGRSPGEGHGYPLQYSCLENPMDRGAPGSRRAARSPQGHKELDTTERLTPALACYWVPGALCILALILKTTLAKQALQSH